MKATVLIITAAGLFCSAAMAQKIVHLKDGSSVEARTRTSGRAMVLKTVFGTRRVAKTDVTTTSPAGPLEEQYAKLAAAVPAGKTAEHQAVAQWCVEKGYLTGLREQLDALLAIDMDDAWANGVLKDVARTYDVHASEGGTRGRDQKWFYDHLLEVLSAEDLAGAVLAREKMSKVPQDIVLRPAIKAMKARSPGTRWLAAQLLRSFRDEPDRIVPLYRRCLCDDSAIVRREAVKSLEVTKDPVFVRLFSKNLWNASPQVRMNAADAIGTFGLKDGIEPLVAALQSSGGGVTRDNVMRLKRIAYVKDFDVEIAQAAVIADPIVDVATEGTILDVGLVGVAAERRAYARALTRLSGADFGTNVAAWTKWWQENQAKDRQQ